MTPSFSANTSLSYDLLPLHDVPLDELAQELARAADNRQSLVAELFDDVRLTKNFVDLLVIALADCRRRSCGSEKAEPKIDLDGQPLFVQRRQLGSDTRAFPACNRQNTNLIVLHERQG